VKQGILRKAAMIEIHPREINGSWDQGYVLDQHTISSTMIGYNEFGHPEFDTVRSELGELVYRLKYKADRSVISSVIETTVGFVNTWNVHPDVVVPVPPSKVQRALQPVVEIASELAKSLGIAVNTGSLRKAKITSQMKDIGDFAARTVELESALISEKDFAGKQVLLIDDLFQSGATMNVAARILKQQGLANRVYALALTRTRS
jgi:competence protein ComFC